MRSTSNAATTPKTIINLDMYENAQNLGAGEGLKIAWRQRRQEADGLQHLDAKPLDVGYLAFKKQNSTDASDKYDFEVGAGIGTATFRVRSDGSASFPSGGPQLATSYVNFDGKTAG